MNSQLPSESFRIIGGFLGGGQCQGFVACQTYVISDIDTDYSSRDADKERFAKSLIQLDALLGASRNVRQFRVPMLRGIEDFAGVNTSANLGKHPKPCLEQALAHLGHTGALKCVFESPMSKGESLFASHTEPDNFESQAYGSILHVAATSGKPQSLQTVISLHPQPETLSVDPVDSRGETPLYVALLRQNIDVVKVLLKARANLDKPYGAFARAQSRIDDDDYYNPDTPLLFACRAGHKSLVELLLHHRADVNAGHGVSSDCRPSPIIAACGTGELFTTMYDYELIHLLLTSRANVDGRANGVPPDSPVRTPLYSACRDFELPTAELLLQYRACVNQADDYGDTPLHAASAAGCSAGVKLLLEWRADASLRARDGTTPYENMMKVNSAKARPRDFLMIEELLGDASEEEGVEDEEE